LNILEEFYLLHTRNFEYALWNIREYGYRTKKITKKNGTARELNIPPSFVKTMQKKINELLQEQYIAPKPVHGFIKADENNKKSIISNANMHTKKYIVINLDIKDFFDSINFGRVRGLFLSKPFEINEKIATRLAQLVINDNKLPQGAPTSPILSNFICKQMDHNLIKVAKKFSLTYSRYADDITFSSHKKNLNLKYIIKEITEVVKNNGFTVNTKKTRFQMAHHTQIVTGLKVNQKVNINTKYKKQIRSMLYSWFTDGLTKATQLHFKEYNKQKRKYLPEKEKSFKNIVIGKINFLGLVCGTDNPLYQKYRHTYFLLSDKFILTRKLDEYEELDINDIKRRKALSIFIQIYNSILIFTEGETDILYIKSALQSFQKKGMYLDLNLRFCNLRGWVNVKNIHEIFYKNTNKSNDLTLINRRKCVSPFIPKSFKLCFILDADDDGIRKYFKHQKHKNYHLIDEANQGYIEKFIDKNIIIDIIKNSGYSIDPTKAGTTKQKLIDHLKDNKEKDEIFSIDNYIVYKLLLIKKTELANIISKKDIDFSNFKEMFDFLKKLEPDNDYADELCCNSLY